MATSRHERFSRQHPPRQPFQAQLSNSVPSTPYQQPRDLRFSSRSPSPNLGLSNQSPRSVVSEAVGQNAPQRAAPAVCKFEIGAEYRKRRIPYVDGGNEELGPPKKEPKETLEPHEDDKLSGDMREMYDRLLPSNESEERRAKLLRKLEGVMNEEWPGNDIKVAVFGSSGNLLSTSDSDVDICVTTTFKSLETIHPLAALLHRHGMEKVVCRASAKVPIVKCWDPELQLACDLNVNNPLALENTRMIKTYVQLDDRVRPLAKIVKHWTKRRILNDAAFGGTISSYTWICMVINFLQRRDPPILPSLQKLPDARHSDVNGEPSRFADDIPSLRGFGDANKESLAELLFQFFRHYGYEFEYSKYVVSVKEGRLLSRKEKGWDPANYADKEARCRLCVEEPFNTPRNLGNSADDYAFSGIHGEIRRAFELLADGCQLEKCCEQYEFPIEEKPIFQKPAPKPKPTLTRSASQSGRPNHEPGTGRSRKGGNRNQSTQRAGNRRASSGALFNHQRLSLLQSPTMGMPSSDYIAARGNLHDQLYQQYQYLQAQSDALRAQLAQQQAQGQMQGRASDLAGSPHHRAFANGLQSPRFQDNPPQTAPLLPGYLYHYPARYPPPSPMSQARSREGTNTNPSSPKLMAAVPALRRQAHRASVTESSSGSTRSQSQPGRSLPHPLTLQQQVHPGYDVSGALGGQYPSLRSSQLSAQSHPSLPVPCSPFTALHPTQSVDNAMPKEYVGYYVGQSPQLEPQYATSGMNIPPMPTLRDPPPHRQRRITPELAPPVPNGRHSSRSPSPLGHLRSYSTTGDLRARQAQILQSPTYYEPPVPIVPAEPSEIDPGGPLIVNGSTPAAQTQPVIVNGTTSPPQPGVSDPFQIDPTGYPTRAMALPLRPEQSSEPENAEAAERPPSPRTSPAPRGKPGARLNFSPNGTPHGPNCASEPFTELSPLNAAPLLSPVAELRTPSPTSKAFDPQTSPQTNGFVKAAQIANAKQAEKSENGRLAEAKHERKPSVPNASAASNKPAKSPTIPAALKDVAQQNPWQEAMRKGHKKSKSSVGQQPQKSPQAQPLPVNEAERKGG